MDDVHTCVITYSADASYTFDLTYTDKAGNSAVYGKGGAADYQEDRFTVDQTVPVRSPSPTRKTHCRRS